MNWILQKFSLVLALLVVSWSSAMGQDTYGKIKAERFPAFKFAEQSDVPKDQWQELFGRFVEAGKAHVSARLLVYVYAAKGNTRTSIAQPIAEYRQFLKEKASRSIESSVEPGGFRKSFSVELWIYSRHDGWPDRTPDEPFRPEKFGEIGEGTDADFIRFLGDYENKLRADMSGQGYIISHGEPKEIARREILIGNNLFVRGTFDGPRITLVNGGPGPVRTVMWLVPPGAAEPTP